VPTLDHTAHLLHGNITITIGGMDVTEYAEQVSLNTNTSGGFGSFSCKLRPPASPPAYEDTIVVSGATSWQGVVTNSPDTPYLGQNESYEVVGEGPAREYGRESDFGIMLVDREVGNWKSIDCQSWDAAPGFTLSGDNTKRLRVAGPDVDMLLEDRSDADHPDAHHYVAYSPAYAAGQMYAGNPVPKPGATSLQRLPHKRGYKVLKRGTYAMDCPDPKPLWFAHYYVVNDGLTPDTITKLRVRARWNLTTPLMDTLTEPNFREPIGPLDPVTRHRFCDYPSYNRWSWFYGSDAPSSDENYPPPAEPMSEPPGCMFGGIYAVDSPEELPVKDPRAMFEHPALIHRFEPRTQTAWGEWDEEGNLIAEPEYVDLDLDVNPLTPESGQGAVAGRKMLVFYVSYKPVQRPYYYGYFYDGPGVTFYENKPDGDTYVHDHLIRNDWRGTTFVYVEPEQFIELTEVAVCGNGFSGNPDVGEALRIIFPTGDIDPLPIDPEASIIIEPFTTKLAAVEELVGMTSERVVWGFWEGGVLKVRRDHDGEISVDPSEPGVTLAATKKQDGVVETVTVVYTDGFGDTTEERVINAWVPQVVKVDREGQPATTGRSTVVDLSGKAHSADAAADAGVSVIDLRGQGTWEGSIGLRSIAGAAAYRAGAIVSGGKCDGALVTSTNVDVDDDSVSLSLGGTGYVGRFPPKNREPGSESPVQERTVMPFAIRARIGGNQKG